MKEDKYKVEIQYISENPLTLILRSGGYKREIGFYKMKKLETDKEFVKRELDIFLSTIKDLRVLPGHIEALI